MKSVAAAFAKTRSFYRSYLWQSRLILATLITVIVLVVVRVSLPYTILYSSIYWLGTQGITAHIEDISIDVSEGTFSVLGAKGRKNGETVFSVGRALIDWQWRPLADKTIHIKAIELEALELSAEKYADAMVIAGVVIKQDGSVQAEVTETDDTVAWGTSLNRIDFRDLGFCFSQYDHEHANQDSRQSSIDYCGDIGLISWQGEFDLTSPEPANDQTTPALTASGDIRLEQLRLHNNKLEGTLVNMGSLTFDELSIDGIDAIDVSRLELAELTLLQNAGHSKHKHAVALDRLDLSGVSIRDTSAISVDKIILNKPVISAALNDAGEYKFNPWLPPASADATDQSVAAASTDKDARTVQLKLGGIDISESELCYQQPPVKSAGITQPLDYCVNLADLNWTGQVAVSLPTGTTAAELNLAGTIKASGLVTSNQLLDRDLGGFEKLVIDGVAVKDTDDIAFSELRLDQAYGLELLGAEGKHTVSLGQLAVSSLHFGANAVSVDRIAVSDLGLDILMNEDGELELEQWKIASADQQASGGTEQADTTSKPLAVRVGEFNFDSNRLMQLTDNSVKPAMQIGFNEFRFNIKQLDSEKPDQQSPLELSAKTTRHGTIVIKGVAKPFEEKPSFDANGKITGFDLRVASPKVEQAAGHIIKSGQLDADLKLLADSGQLDSKISLVLHHFNLKAKSKEDAAALDKTFGMPINQSLVLLKDKKGRIKLDIPITGDINNPEFDPTDAIIKATTKATTVTLITFYTPYGLAFAGGNLLLDLASALNFDPLAFAAGSADLDAEHEKQLTKLAELLVERPAVYLTLCGYTNLNDREKMFTEIIDREKIKPVSADRLVKLKQLGDQRQENVKNHLISHGKIAHDRLILCEPEHNDDAVSTSGVEISI